MNTEASTPSTRNTNSTNNTEQAPRRSRLVTWGIASMLVVTTALAACGHRHHHGHEGISEERVTKMVDKVFSRVDASDDQKSRISTIANKAVSKLKPMRQAMRQARADGVDLLSADPVDRAAIEGLRAQQIEAANKASTVMSEALADIAEVLTPEQRLQVRDKLSKRMKWHGADKSSE